MSFTHIDDEELRPRKPAYFIVEHSEKEMINVNADCILKLIYEYIRIMAGIPENLEFDLCDEDGTQKFLFEAPEGANGLDFFEHRNIYYIILLERNKYGAVSNPRILLSSNHRFFHKLMKALAKKYERHSGESEGTSRSFASSSKQKRRLSKRK